MSTDPAATNPNDAEQPRQRTPEDFTVAEVRRGVRIQGWLILGIVLGLVLSFIFAMFLPENEDFTRGQVLGFLAVFLTALTVVVVVGIALIVNFFMVRNSKPQHVLLERVPEVDDELEYTPDDEDASEVGGAIGAAQGSNDDVDRANDANGEVR